MMLFEKTKAWEKEITANDRSNLKITTLEATLLSMTASRDALHSKVRVSALLSVVRTLLLADCAAWSSFKTSRSSQTFAGERTAASRCRQCQL